MVEETGEFKRDSTDLIDVSDVAAELDDVTPQPAQEVSVSEAIAEPSLEPQAMEGPAAASLGSRFTAFALDVTILYVCYWFMMMVYRSIALGTAAGPVPARGIHGLIFHGLFLLMAFLYFFLLWALRPPVMEHSRADYRPLSVTVFLLRVFCFAF